MRLHQRVGRLNRIGQNEVVKVMLFQNPDTVESRIWDLLNEKLERIRQSINSVTEEPEDLHQLVLGIARPGMLDTVFSQAQFVPRAKLDEWFDSQTGQMGGEDAVRVVQDLLGHAQHFDFAQVSDRFRSSTCLILHPSYGLLSATTDVSLVRQVGCLPSRHPRHGRRLLESNRDTPSPNSSPNCAPQGLQILLGAPLYSIENTCAPAFMNRLLTEGL